MDQAFAMMFELLENIHGLLRDNREELDSLLSAAANMVRSLDGIFTRHGDRIDRIMENIETATDQTNELLTSANGVISGPRVQRTLRNVDGITSSINRDIDPLLADARSIAGKVDDALDMLGEEQQQQIQSTIADVSDITHRATGITEDAEQIVTHIRQGRGTVGAMLMDEEIYDDVQEMLRDLKHNPWKLFWRE
jgi:phospholipid/cholesterol/gamma-HCH transport system substrate-binding protein